METMDDIAVDTVITIGSVLFYQRNLAVGLDYPPEVDQSEAIYDREFDFYLALDADVSFKLDDVRKLIAHDLDIVGGAVIPRRLPSKFSAGHWHNGDYRFTDDDYLSNTTTGLVEVDWIGMGFTLIKRDVFRKMRYPWFRDYIYEYKNPKSGKLCVSVGGEDITFCKQAGDLGYKIYCDCDCRPVHHVETVGG